MNQKLLFEVEAAIGQYGQPIEPASIHTPLARLTDPPTSHQGEQAAILKVSGNRKLFLETLRKSKKPLTAEEVAANAIPFQHTISVSTVMAKRSTIRKRAHELLAAGFIKKTGSRPCEVTGNEASIYVYLKGLD